MPGAERWPACPGDGWAMATRRSRHPGKRHIRADLALSGSQRPGAGTAGAADPGAGGRRGRSVSSPSPAGCGNPPMTRRRSRYVRRLIWPPARGSAYDKPDDERAKEQKEQNWSIGRADHGAEVVSTHAHSRQAFFVRVWWVTVALPFQVCLGAGLRARNAGRCGGIVALRCRRVAGGPPCSPGASVPAVAARLRSARP